MKLTPLALVVVALLAGCTPVSAPQTQPDIPASILPSAFDIACSDVAPIDQLRALWGGEVVPMAYHEAGAAGSWEMQGTALLQDGALACGWGQSGGDHTQLLVLALPDARDGFERSEPSFLGGEVFPYVEMDVADAGSAFCRTDDAAPGVRCHWNVLVGETWLSVFLQDVPASELDADDQVKPDGVAADIVARIADALAGASAHDVDRAEPSIPSCDSALQPAQIAEWIGVDPSQLAATAGRPVESMLGYSTPAFGQVMWAYSFERLGYSECQFRTETITGSAIVAPGAAWILDDPDAVQPAVTEVEGFGRGFQSCVSDAAFRLCTMTVTAGDDLVVVQVSPDTTEQGLELATTIARALVPDASQP